MAIIRLRELEPADEILRSLVDGAVRSIEVTLPTPGSTAAVARWRGATDATIGMGTIRSTDDVRRAHDAGAEFLVTPTTSVPVLELAAELGLPVICGALTPTEIDTAVRAGAALVKVFPIDAVGGIRYLKAVAAPLNDVRFVPTGGIGAAEAEEYARFGCAGVGVGSSLVSEPSVATRDWTGIGAQARLMTEAWGRGV